MTTYTTSRGPCARPGCFHLEYGHKFRDGKERGRCLTQDLGGKCSCPQYVPPGVRDAAA